jgi:hypothetical protein
MDWRRNWWKGLEGFEGFDVPVGLIVSVLQSGIPVNLSLNLIAMKDMKPTTC